MKRIDNPYNNPSDQERPEDGMFSKHETFDAGAKAQLESCEEEFGKEHRIRTELSKELYIALHEYEELHNKHNEVMREIFEELDTHQVSGDHVWEELRGLVIFSKGQYQALKEKYLNESPAKDTEGQE